MIPVRVKILGERKIDRLDLGRGRGMLHAESIVERFGTFDLFQIGIERDRRLRDAFAASCATGGVAFSPCAPPHLNVGCYRFVDSR